MINKSQSGSLCRNVKWLQSCICLSENRHAWIQQSLEPTLRRACVTLTEGKEKQHIHCNYNSCLFYACKWIYERLIVSDFRFCTRLCVVFFLKKIILDFFSSHISICRLPVNKHPAIFCLIERMWRLLKQNGTEIVWGIKSFSGCRSRMIWLMFWVLLLGHLLFGSI